MKFFKVLLGVVITCVVLALGLWITGLVLQDKGIIDFTFDLDAAGSSVAFSRELDESYEIKELGIRSNGNSFMFDDYFVSESLGKEYEITMEKYKIPIGKIYLAKKEDYYNPEKYSFNLDDYSYKILTIPKDMNYVTLTQTYDGTIQTMIKIENRTLPLELTLDGINITSVDGASTVISESFQDVMLIVKGENHINCSAQPYTVEEYARAVESGTSKYLNAIKDTYDTLKNMSDAMKSGTWSVLTGSARPMDAINSVASSFLAQEKAYFDKAVNAVSGVLVGEDGVAGKDGSDAFVHFGALCIYTPTAFDQLFVTGGAGRRGTDASKYTVFGLANGGTGGSGGNGVKCETLIVYGSGAILNGGSGAEGGKNSEAYGGLFGNSMARGSASSGGKGAAYRAKRSWFIDYQNVDPY